MKKTTYAIVFCIAAAAILTTCDPRLPVNPLDPDYDADLGMTTAAPVFGTAPGAVLPGTQVTITCETEGAYIYLTCDGTNPEIDETCLYTDPITVNEDMTIAAAAWKHGMGVSPLVSVSYTVYDPGIAADPVFDPPEGAITVGTEVTITCSTPGASIYFTTDGTSPELTAPYLYSAPVTVDTDMTITAVAWKDGMNASTEVSAAYTVFAICSLTVSNNGNGTTDPSGTTVVVPLEDTPITATSDSGCYFVEWSVISGTGVSFADSQDPTTTVNLSGGDAEIRAVCEPSKITYSGAGHMDYFGQVVALDGDYAICGGVGIDAWTEGAAIIYHWNGAEWEEQAKLIGDEPRTDGYFGGNVTLSGERAACSCTGMTYVFKRSGTTWTKEATLIPAGLESDDSLGQGMGFMGDWILLGATGDDDAYTNSGKVYSFHWNGSAWTEEQNFKPADIGQDDCFGKSVRISGDHGIIGTWGSFAADCGEAAYIYHWTGTEWEEEQKLTASDGVDGDDFGISGDIDGDYAVVGAPIAEAAYVFHWNGTTWEEQAILSESATIMDDGYGYSVAVSGDYVLVGARYDDDKYADAGAAYLYHRNGTEWTKVKKLTACDTPTSDHFGVGLDLQGSYALIGADYDDIVSSDSGSAYFFNVKE